MYGINWLLMLCMLLSMNACVESKSSLEDYVDQIKKTAKSHVEPIPPPKQIKSEQYSAETIRSPFVLTGGNYSTPAVLTGPGGELIQQAARPDLDRPREYLEQFPLASLIMVGTLSKPGTNWGLIKDGNGMIHAVKMGDYMGQNAGKIIAITPDQIKLNETVPNGNGGWMQARAALNLVASTEEVTGSQPTVAPLAPNKSQTKPTTQQPTPQQTKQPQTPVPIQQQSHIPGRGGL